MQVKVKYSLFGRSARRRDQVHALGRKCGVDGLADAQRGTHQLSGKPRFCLPQVCDVCLRDDERVPWRRGLEREERYPERTGTDDLDIGVFAASDGAEVTLSARMSGQIVLPPREA